MSLKRPHSAQEFRTEQAALKQHSITGRHVLESAVPALILKQMEEKIMKNFKRIAGSMLAAITALSMVACGDTNTSTETTDSFATYKVGICNYVDDASLNQIVENIQNRLSELGNENNITFEITYDNCNADANVMNQIIANFEADNVDLMVGVATPVAMAMQSATETSGTPVVFAAVSDPVSCGIVESLEAPGKNITGTSDYLDTASVMNLIFALDSSTNIGLLYDMGQDSSTTAIAEAKKILEDKGYTYTEYTATNVSEAQLAVSSMIADGNITSVFTPSDNTIMTAELSIYEDMANAGIKHFTGADSFALNGAFLGYGVDYANLGVETADMIYDILVNGSNPATLAVKTFDNGTATVNTEVTATLGLDFEEVKNAISPYCTKVAEITTAESFGE